MLLATLPTCPSAPRNQGHVRRKRGVIHAVGGSVRIRPFVGQERPRFRTIAEQKFRRNMKILAPRDARKAVFVIIEDGDGMAAPCSRRPIATMVRRIGPMIKARDRPWKVTPDITSAHEIDTSAYALEGARIDARHTVERHAVER